MKEVWKNIIGYENLYQISNKGFVASLDRIVNGNQQNPYRNLKGKVLRSGVDGMGYKRINLLKNGKQKSFTIHRLLAIYFINNSNNLAEVNHIDGNKLNNSLNNLEWCSHKANMKHARDNGLIVNYKTSKVLQYDKNENLINRYGSIINASKETKINKSTISRNCRNIRPTAGGFVWKYDNGNVNCSDIAKQCCRDGC